MDGISNEFIAKTFSYWTTTGPSFMQPVGSKGEQKAYYPCVCICGVTRYVLMASLRSGKSTGCGCLRASQIQLVSTKHGKSKTAEYGIWKRMRQRCNNKKSSDYQFYGGRGIKVCERWDNIENGFISFYEDMGPRPTNKHSIERKRNEDGYGPDNCIWATTFEQHRNQRSNVILTYNGKTQCQQDWAEELGIPRQTLYSRIKAGWSIERILGFEDHVSYRS